MLRYYVTLCNTIAFIFLLYLCPRISEPMPSSEVRGQDENGEPFFCGKDVCKALGYKRTDKAIRRHVNSSNVLKRSIARIVKNRYGQSTKTQKVEMLFVNESGVYSLVFGSKLDTRRSLPTSNDQVDPLQEVAAAAPRRAGFLRCSHPRWQYRQGHARLHPRG